jgi:hypothetical protein
VQGPRRSKKFIFASSGLNASEGAPGFEVSWNGYDAPARLVEGWLLPPSRYCSFVIEPRQNSLQAGQQPHLTLGCSQKTGDAVEVSMWACQQCGEQIEDQFDSCWKCAGQEAAAKSEAPPPPVQCLRCQTTTKYAGSKYFHENDWMDFGVHREHYEVYICPKCRHVELFAAEIGKVEAEKLEDLWPFS